MPINQTNLSNKIVSLKQTGIIKDRVLEDFQEIICSLSDWELFRINPYTFASEHQLNNEDTIQLFLHATKVGLFDFSWNMICPMCGGVEYSHHSVNTIQEGFFHCAMCNIDVESHLDDQVEVAFKLNESINTLEINPFDNQESYFRFFFTPNHVIPEEFKSYMEGELRGFTILESNSKGVINFEAKPGQELILFSLDRHQSIPIKVRTSADSKSQAIEIIMTYQGFNKEIIYVSPGPISLNINNQNDKFLGLNLFKRDWETLGYYHTHHPIQVKPFLTGKLLLNHQTFRELFGFQVLNPNLKLSIRSITLLFTDLKGSTALYDNTGDAFAYDIVQQHFDLLIEAVRHHQGAIVKTMGDAIMATFSKPFDAIQSAIKMHKKIESLNEKLKESGQKVGLKIGIHEGPVLVVNAADRLDYFGQSVNISARVEGLADSGEIWITEPIIKADKITETLESNCFNTYFHEVSLKGVGEKVKVFQCKVNH